MSSYNTCSEIVSADLPKSTPQEDCYGFAPFAKSIAAMVTECNSENGFTIALDGEWGSGKTTILNFIKNYIHEKSNDTIIIDFNPWWYSGKDQLAFQFIKRMQSVVGHDVGRQIAGTLSRTLEKYGKAITLAANAYGIPIPKGASSAVASALKPIEKDFADLKKDVVNAIKELDKRIVVCIDDSDRLSPDELSDLFKLIKAIADFPNVIYIIPFDKKIISSNIKSKHKIDGNSYIEKIIQICIPVPQASNAILRQQLKKNLSSLTRFSTQMETLSADDLNKEIQRLLLIIDIYMAKDIQKPRTITRVTNTIATRLLEVHQDINFCDMTTICLIYELYPEVYNTIKYNKEKFLPSNAIDIKEQLIKFHESYLSKTPPEKHERIKQILQKLFPQLDFIFKNTTHSNSTYRKCMSLGRLCIDNNFEYYFSGIYPEGSIPIRIIKQFFSNNNIRPLNTEQIASTLTKFQSDNNASDGSIIFSTLRDAIETLTQDQIINSLITLFSTADIIIDTQADTGIFLSRTWAIEFAAIDLLGALEVGTRKKLLTAIANTAPLPFTCHFISSCLFNISTSDEHKFECCDTLKDTQHLNELMAITLDRIQVMHLGAILNNKHLKRLIYATINHADETILDKYTQLFSTPQMAFSSLRKLTSTSTESTSEYTRTHEHLPIDGISKIMDAEKTLKMLSDHQEHNKCTEDETHVIEMLKESYDIRLNGGDPDSGSAHMHRRMKRQLA